MATIKAYDTKAGKRYRVRYRKPDGSQTDKRGFKTKRDADTFLANTTVAKSKGEYIDPSDGKITVGELAAAWLEKKETSLKKSAYAPLATSWRVHVAPKWEDWRISDIRPTEVEMWITQMRKGTAPAKRERKSYEGNEASATIVLRALSVLAGTLDDAVRDGRISRNPARGLTNLPRKAPKEHRRYLTHEEVLRLGEASPDRIRRVLLVMLCFTGLRWGEAVALRVRDVNMLKHRVNVNRTATEVEGSIEITLPKSWEKRAVPFPQFLTASIAKLCENKGRDDLVFGTGKDGFIPRPDTANGRYSWWLTSLRKANIEHMTPHDLRHTAASIAVSAGANVKVLQLMLGHKSAAMTLDVYADLFDDDLNAVAEKVNERALNSNVGKMWAITLSA